MGRGPDLDEMTPGEWVHHRRLALGLTLEEVAERADVAPADISRVESGQAKDVAERLRTALAARPSALLARHRGRVLEAAARLGIRNVRVLGSVARGDDQTDPDVDLLVDLPPGASLFTVAEFAADVSRILTVRVDVINDSPSRHKVRAAARAESVAL